MNQLQELLAQAQQGQVIDNLARSYGISPQEAQQAVDALLPAFTVGLERSTSTPEGLAGLVGAMARNPYSQAFDDPEAAPGGALQAQGTDALAAMFGSPDVSRAVAAHASSETGLSSSLLQQMLPAIAALVLGGLMKGGGGGLGDLLGGLLGGRAPGGPSSGAATGEGGGLGGGGLGDLLGGILGGGAPAGRAGEAGPSGNPLQDILDGLSRGGFGGGAPREEAAPGEARPGPTGNPLDDLLGGMLGGGQREPGTEAETGGVPQPRQEGAPANPGDLLGSILGELFGGAAGRGTPGAPGGSSAQDPSLQPLNDIFDQFTRKDGGR